jgi:hypothetical protein
VICCRESVATVTFADVRPCATCLGFGIVRAEHRPADVSLLTHDGTWDLAYQGETTATLYSWIGQEVFCEWRNQAVDIGDVRLAQQDIPNCVGGVDKISITETKVALRRHSNRWSLHMNSCVTSNDDGDLFHWEYGAFGRGVTIGTSLVRFWPAEVGFQTTCCGTMEFANGEGLDNGHPSYAEVDTCPNNCTKADLLMQGCSPASNVAFYGQGGTATVTFDDCP